MLNEAMKKMMETVNENVKNYIDAYNGHETKKKALSELKNKATRSMNDYNLALSKVRYKEWASEGEPVKKAIAARLISGAKKITYKADDDDFMTAKIVDAEYPVNLPMMQAVIGAEAFNDPKWFDKVERLAKTLAIRINERITGNDSFQYEIGKSAGEFHFPEGVDPLSDEGVIYALNIIFDSILFIDDGNGKNRICAECKVDGSGRYYASEWDTIRESMTRSDGTNSIAICNTSKFTEYIMNAMHGIMTDGEFRVNADERDVNKLQNQIREILNKADDK